MIFGVPSDRKMPSLCQLMMTGPLWGVAWGLNYGRPSRRKALSLCLCEDLCHRAPQQGVPGPGPIFLPVGGPKVPLLESWPGPVAMFDLCIPFVEWVPPLLCGSPGRGSELKCSPVASLDDLHRKRERERERERCPKRVAVFGGNCCCVTKGSFEFVVGKHFVSAVTKNYSTLLFRKVYFSSEEEIVQSKLYAI